MKYFDSVLHKMCLDADVDYTDKELHAVQNISKLIKDNEIIDIDFGMIGMSRIILVDYFPETKEIEYINYNNNMNDFLFLNDFMELYPHNHR